MKKYAVVRVEGGNWAVKAVTDPAEAASFDSRLEAAAALPRDDSEERVLAFGGVPTFKSIDDETVLVSGYAILFTTKADPDLYKDYFTKATDFYLEEGQTDFTIPYVLYHHGLDKTMKGARLATNAAARIDDAGVWVEFQMKKSDGYRKGIAEMAKKGKLGFSTGSAAHLATKKAVGDGVNEITAWPCIEVSLTPTPIESRTMQTLTLKAYEEDLAAMESLGVSAGQRASFGAGVTRFIGDYCEDRGLKFDNVVKALGVAAIRSPEAIKAILDGDEQPTGVDIKAFARTLRVEEQVLRDLAGPARRPQSIKGVFQDELDSQGWKAWELWSALSKVVAKIVNAAAATEMTGQKFDKDALIKEAVGEFAGQLSQTIIAQSDDYLEGDCDYSFYLRALVDPTDADVMAMKGVAVEDHSALAVSAFDSLASRIRAEAAGRIKAGRPISKKNYTVMQGHIDAMKKRLGDAEAHLKTMADGPSDKESRDRVKALEYLQGLELQLLTEE